jgi:hypothetical protein
MIPKGPSSSIQNNVRSQVLRENTALRGVVYFFFLKEQLVLVIIGRARVNTLGSVRQGGGGGHALYPRGSTT